MATPSFSPERRNPLPRRIALSAVVLLILVGLALGVVVWQFKRAAMAALPQLDGAVQVAGLTAPVTVIRDAHGVPHIRAANVDDLFFAQGFITAQDRLWQMDINRRFGRGELSEIFGDRTLKIDKQQRTLQMKHSAEAAVAILPEQTRRHLEAYARGVNALIAQQRDHLPVEFRILRYQPRPWTVADSITIGLNIAQNLSTQYDVEYGREAMAAKLTPEELADLYLNSSWRDRPPSALPRDQQFTPAPPPPAASLHQDNEWLRQLVPMRGDRSLCDDCRPGSNNWVVSGARTVTGKPLLSNDMHLQHSIPNVWYETHLTSGDYDVVGVSFPGLPWVIAGHNQRIAWGYTNLGPDVQDLFVENFNAQGEYETPQGWQKPEMRREVIKVKGSPDVALDIPVTRHGPIVSGIFPGEKRQIALQWTIYDPQTVALEFFKINSAQNWQEFTQAISRFGGATQNVVYADVDGHIGYHAAGFVPTRAGGDGLSIVPGNTDQYSWTGYVPFDQLPSVYDPATGVIATANGKVTPDGYKYMLANQWSAPYRTERIYRVLESGAKLSADDMLHLEMDTYSEFDRTFANALVYAIDHAKTPSDKVRKAADLMRAWNGRMEIDSTAAIIPAKARRQLWRMILEPKVGQMWTNYQWFYSSGALERLVRMKPARWLPRDYTNWDDLLAGVVAEVMKDAPADLSTWKYGEQFPIRLNHPLFGDMPWINKYSGPGVHPQSGSGLTVKAAGTVFGASERMTVDLSDLDASRLNIVAGQSGQIFSPYYMDQWDAWYHGSTFALPFSAAAVDHSAAHRLELRP
jgi:penicillin amidase